MVSKNEIMKRTFLDLLEAWKKEKNRKPLVIRGVRQVGKTYLLKKFGLQFPAFHYLNFEKNPSLCDIFDKDLDPKRIIEEISFCLDKPINTKTDFVIFDEVQECPKALTSLKYFYEDLPDLHLCSAGSLLGIHLAPLSFLVGKVTFLTMRPMSFEEFLLAIGDEKGTAAYQGFQKKRKLSEVAHAHLWEKMKLYFVVGGMPEAVATYCEYLDDPYQAFKKVRLKQEELVLAYYADMTKHSGKVNALHIDRVFRSIPTQLEHAIDGSVAKFKFKGVVPGISHYHRLASAIDWLEAAGLVLKVPIIHTGRLPLKAFEKENVFKLLLFDVGILGSMSQLSPELILSYDYGTYKGFFAENFVAQEFLLEQHAKICSWCEGKAELEFLREENGKPVPIEVKSGRVTRSKSLKAFMDKYPTDRQIILSGKPFSINKETGTEYIPLYLAAYCFSMKTNP